MIGDGSRDDDDDDAFDEVRGRETYRVCHAGARAANRSLTLNKSGLDIHEKSHQQY